MRQGRGLPSPLMSQGGRERGAGGPGPGRAAGGEAKRKSNRLPRRTCDCQPHEGNKRLHAYPMIVGKLRCAHQLVCMPARLAQVIVSTRHSASKKQKAAESGEKVRSYRDSNSDCEIQSLEC